ncbi:MAG: sulfite exporter TauE/SafE family protein [Candidatus Bathyarchaeota archaeon]|nr:sulfite exporter TauE/SafE family protein [Candidatus Bathyarchaeota archaeon]
MLLGVEMANPYIEAFAIGLLYGLVFCTSSCLPYVASYIAGVGADFRKGVIVTLTYNIGRVAAYTVIGSLAGILSSIFRFAVNEHTIAMLQHYASYALAAVSIAIGVNILLKSKKASQNCTLEVKNTNRDRQRVKIDAHAFLLGFSRGLIICPPLAMLLFYTIPFSSPFDSSILPVLFGIGTTISPILLLGGVTGWLLNKTPLFRRKLAIIGGAALILLGIIALANNILK